MAWTTWFFILIGVLAGCTSPTQGGEVFSTKALTGFRFDSPVATATVSEASHSVSVSVPFATPLTALVPIITHTGVSLSPPSGVAQDFTSPVVYTVKAADGTTQGYTARVDPRAPGSAWEAQGLPAAADWSAVAYGSGVYVAVNFDPGTAASSTDGITWTPRTISVANWTSVVYAGGQFVAVSNDGHAATSPDGVTWTDRPIGGARWAAVAYGNGTYVAIANNASTDAATSPDGITWTPRTLPDPVPSPGEDGAWQALTFGNGVFVALDSFTNRVATSPDGVTWTLQTLPSSGRWNSVCWGKDQFVAVSQDSSVATSPDGVTWTTRVVPSGTWYAVTWGAGYFSAVGWYGKSMVSPDGLTWTQRSIGDGLWTAVTFGYGAFLTIASESVSTDPGKAALLR